MQSPFSFGKIVTGPTFTNRVDEVTRLRDNVESHINTVLISPRRWGKSSLVAKAGVLLGTSNPSIRLCYIDLFNIRTEADFYSSLAREVLRVSFTKWEERVESAKRFFKRVTPKFTLGTDPLNDFSVSFDLDETTRFPDEILDLPEAVSREKRLQVVVCVDEFQNVGYFDDPTAFQKKLRARWQHHKLATYCLYGSKRHLMEQLFDHKAMPFYKFGDIIFLEKISEAHWIPFIVTGFRKSGKEIGEGLAAGIAAEMENHPYFVQQLAHEVWRLTKTRCTEEVYHSALQGLLVQHDLPFQREVDGLTNLQVNFLRAVCDGVTQLSSTETIRTYGLGSSGNVNRVRHLLVNKEVLDVTYRGIEFIDPLFKKWFSTVFIRRS